ncbi:MAG TPA: carbohydrate ABC transporter permease [Chloroflexota bacterium]|nr:carbohydrate ABC transporter permease [Chloroflexota bacterium]
MSSAAATRQRASAFASARLQHALGRAALYLVVVLLGIVFATPLFWTLTTSLKASSELMVFPPALLPAQLHFENFPRAWNAVPFGAFYRNTAVVTVLGTLGAAFSSSLVAYGFARGRFPGRTILFWVVLSQLMLPPEITIIPKFLIFKQLGWIDTLKPLIVPDWFGGGAFNIFLLRQFFMTIPRTFDEAAEIDGAGSFRILWSILLPLCTPALITVAILSFLRHWNDFLEPLIYLNSPDMLTLSLGLRYFLVSPSEGGEPKDHLLMAAVLMAALPCVVLFFVAQRYFVKGIVMSGIKG